MITLEIITSSTIHTFKNQVSKSLLIAFGGGSSGLPFNSSFSNNGWPGGIAFDFTSRNHKDEIVYIGAGGETQIATSGGNTRINNAVATGGGSGYHGTSELNNDGVAEEVYFYGKNAMGVLETPAGLSYPEYADKYLIPYIQSVWPALLESVEWVAFDTRLRNQKGLIPNYIKTPIEYNYTGLYLPGAAGSGETSLGANNGSNGNGGAVFIFSEVLNG